MQVPFHTNPPGLVDRVAAQPPCLAIPGHLAGHPRTYAQDIYGAPALQALAERAGEISGLEIQPRFPLVVNGQDCGSYVGDFAYVTKDGERVVEDVKSAATRKLPTYRLKRRLVWALYGLTVVEVA